MDPAVMLRGVPYGVHAVFKTNAFQANSVTFPGGRS